MVRFAERLSPGLLWRSVPIQHAGYEAMPLALYVDIRVDTGGVVCGVLPLRS